MQRTAFLLILRNTRLILDSGAWRDHNISFLKYCNICTELVHDCIKKPKDQKYNKFSKVGYYAQKPMDGALQPVTVIPTETKDY